MNIWIKILSIFFIFSLIFLPKNIEARSGCCSHHGGVCGCRCCDGSSLSATCAPYYPSCGSVTTVKTVQPTSTPRPTSTPTKTPTKVPTIIPTNNLTPTSDLTRVLVTNDNQNNDSLDSSDGSIGGLVVLGLLGFGGYKLVKKFKNKKNEEK
jgi:hypothetical protein